MNNQDPAYHDGGAFRSDNQFAVFEDDADGGQIGMYEKYLDIARNNKLLIAGVLALAMAIGLVATLLTTPQYRSTTRIEIAPAEQNVTNVEGLQSERVMTDRAYLPTQYELLESRSLALRVMRELDLTEDEDFLEAFEISPETSTDLERTVIGTLFNNVEIDPIDQSLLVDISFSSPSPDLSARIANAWAEAYIAENLDRRFGATLEARDFLEERLAQTRERLEDAERAVIAYAAQQGLVSVANSGEGGDSGVTASQTLVASELEAVNQALQEATTARIAAEAALAARRDSVAAPETNSSAGLRAQRAELAVELAELRSRFNSDYPPLQALEAQLAEIDRAIANERSEGTTRLQAAYAEALNQEQQMRSRVAELRDQFAAQRRDSVEYNILQREVDTNREIYAGLLQRYREIGVVGVGESNIVIVDEAEPATGPYKPSLIQNLLLALIVGIVLVAAGIYLYDLLNQSPRNPQQVKERLGLDLLGSIPRAPEETMVEELAQSYTQIYESYFTLTNGIANKNNGMLPRSVMLTSSRPGEGKSFSAVALAYLIARQGKKVLLLDCDLRKSGMSKYVETDTPIGVTQYLQGNDDWRSMIVKPDPLQGFDVIPAGRNAPSVAELLATDRFAKLLNEVEAEYDHIVVDGPPVLGLVDAPAIASALDGVVLIIEANEGKWRYIEGAMSRLRQGNAAILGAAVTKLDERNQMYGFGYGYGYGYGYGADGSSKHKEEELA